LYGRVNVSNAPRPVLLGIPGLTPDHVEQILSARSAAEDTTRNRVNAVWLLAESIVDLPAMKRIWPAVTVGGDVFRAQIVAFYDARSPWHRQPQGPPRSRRP